MSASVVDDEWIDAIADRSGPWFFAIEAVLCYLPERDVRRALEHVATRFPRAHVAFDTWGDWMRDHQDEHDALQHMDARVNWFVEDPAILEAWDLGFRLRDSRILPNAQPELLGLLPPEVREMLPALAEDPQVRSYKLNLFEVVPAAR